MASVIGLSLPLKCLIPSYCVKALSQCALNTRSSLISDWENVLMPSTTSLFADGDLVLHVFLRAWFILFLCRPCHSVSPLRFRHSSRLIQINTLAAVAFVNILA